MAQIYRRRPLRGLTSLLLLLPSVSFVVPFRGERAGSTRRCVQEKDEESNLASKEKLFKAIEIFQEELNRTSNLSIDFGVKGGELDEKDRAPTNLVSNGAFHRASPALGKAAEAVLQEVEALKGGVAEPLKEFGTAKGSRCPLHGAWRLRFTTAADATFTRNSSRGTAKVSNVVDAVKGCVTNCIDFDTPAAAECLRVRLTAEAETPTRLGLAFRYVKIRLTKFLGISLGQRRRLTLQLPVPGPFLTRIITFFTRKSPPKPYFEILYLDHDLRVHKTGQGNVFVQEKMSLPPPYL